MTAQVSTRIRSMAALEELLERSGANAAIIASRDGRPFAEKTRERIGVESGRLAAMASSLAALGDGVLRELSSGALDHVLIEGSGGKFVVCRIPGAHNALVLAVHAGASARLGLVLGQAKACAVTLGTLITVRTETAPRS